MTDDPAAPAPAPAPVPTPAAAAFAAELATAVAHLRTADAALAPLLEQFAPCGLEPRWERSPYESLVRSVAHQHVHGRAAEAILARLIARHAPAPFPQPADILADDEGELRAVGLSASKILAIRDIARHAEQGVVPDRAAAEALDDETLIAQLIPIRGVGRWTVEMLLIFTLGRLDVMPVDDFGVRRGVMILRGCDAMPGKREMAALTDVWRPYRSVASWYMWRLSEATGRRPAAASDAARTTRGGRAPRRKTP